MNPKLFWVCNDSHDLQGVLDALASTPATCVQATDGSSVTVITTTGYEQCVRFDARATSARLRAVVDDDAPVETVIAVMALQKMLGGTLTDGSNNAVVLDSSVAIAKACGASVPDIQDHAEAYRLVMPSVKWNRIASSLAVSF